jgi:hypothetical protein
MGVATRHDAEKPSVRKALDKKLNRE